jgi:hypothetical protein
MSDSKQMTWEEEILLDLREDANTAYTAYCRAVGGVAFNGDPLPTWEEFSSDDSKQKQVNAWIEVARALYVGMPMG